MAEQRYESFQNGLEGCTDEELERFECLIMERRGRAAAPETVAPIDEASARPTSMGMFIPSTMPELRGRENLGTFLKRFRTWKCLNQCHSALDSEIAVTTSETPRVGLERLHNYDLVENFLKVWQALTKALEKEKEIMRMVIEYILGLSQKHGGR